MPRLRVQPDVVPAAGDVQVDVLEQFGHLRDENLPTPLRLNEVERTRESSAGPPRERCHSGRASRIATAPATAASSGWICAGRSGTSRSCGGRIPGGSSGGGTPASRSAASLWLRQSGEIDPQLL